MAEEWDDRDPLIILLERESQSCKGCAHELFYTAFDAAVWICTTKDEKDKRRNHGRRCKQYREK
jgi:hypothetical protein